MRKPSHSDFDAAFRFRETGRSGSFCFCSHLIGTCGAVAGRSGSVSRLSMDASWKHYALEVGLVGIVALIQPTHHGSSLVQRQRVFGTPAYMLDFNESGWRWLSIPDSAAGPFEWVVGSEHQVGWRTFDWSIGPSDPTIEQFDPSNGVVKLFIVV